MFTPEAVYHSIPTEQRRLERRTYLELHETADEVEEPDLRDLFTPGKVYDLVSALRSPPEKYPIDRLSSFAVMGLDIKITPENKVKLIEANGIRSGMSYYEGLGFNPNKSLREYIDSLGIAPIAYIGALLENMGLQISNVKMRRIWGAHFVGRPRQVVDITEASNGHPMFLVGDKGLHSMDEVDIGWFPKYVAIAKRIKGIEDILKDKFEFDGCCGNARDFKHKSYRLTKKGILEFLEDNESEYAVVKPTDRSGGEGFEIWAPANLKERLGDYVLESFLPSKPISYSGQYHDGCMRYLIFVEEHKKGKIMIHHFGGYWRLCPKPISDYGDIDAMRANACQSAIPAAVSREDLALVRNVVDVNIPTIYRAMAQEIRKAA